MMMKAMMFRAHGGEGEGGGKGGRFEEENPYLESQLLRHSPADADNKLPHAVHGRGGEVATVRGAHSMGQRTMPGLVPRLLGLGRVKTVVMGFAH